MNAPTDDQIKTAFLEVFDKADLDSLEDAYLGHHDSPEDYVQDFLEDVGDMSSLPAWVRYNINWDGVVSDFEMDGYYFVRIGVPPWGVLVFNGNAI